MPVYFFQGLVPCLPFSKSKRFVLLQHMQEFYVSSCLPFSCLSSFTDRCLVYPFHGQDVSISYAIRRQYWVLCVYVDAYTLLSRIGSLSIFFTVRLFRSLTEYMHAYFVSSCATFLRVYAFFTDRYLIYLYTLGMSLCNTIGRNFRVLYINIFHACLLNSRNVS